MSGNGFYRGIVLKESLRKGRLPNGAKRWLVKTYPYLLDGRMPMTVFRLSVPAAAVSDVARLLSRQLHPAGYFAQLTGDDEMLVVFPGRTLAVARGCAASAGAARAVGAELGIPPHQMRFELMFENDHPNVMEEGT